MATNHQAHAHQQSLHVQRPYRHIWASPSALHLWRDYYFKECNRRCSYNLRNNPFCKGIVDVLYTCHFQHLCRRHRTNAAKKIRHYQALVFFTRVYKSLGYWRILTNDVFAHFKHFRYESRCIAQGAGHTRSSRLLVCAFPKLHIL